MIVWHSAEGITDAGTEGTGGKMGDYGSWLNKGTSWAMDKWSTATRAASNYSVPGILYRGATNNHDTPYSAMIRDEVQNKSDLRSAQLLEGLSNVPIVGNVIRGIQGVNRLEDLYNNTGRTAYYAGSGVSGAGALGSAAGQLAKIADGSHDLYEFYSGSLDDFRNSMNGMYQ